MILDEKKQETKLPAIVKAAVRLFVERGVASTTIRDIAREAGVAEGTLYRHFASKEDLAHAILVENLGTFTRFLDAKIFACKDLKSRVRALAEAFIDAFADNPDIARYMLLSHASEMSRLPKGMRTPRHVVEDIFKEAVKDGDVDAGMDWEVMQAMVLGSLSRLLLASVFGEVRGDLASRKNDVAKALLRMVSV